jgi:hypothetical protein
MTRNYAKNTSNSYFFGLVLSTKTLEVFIVAHFSNYFTAFSLKLLNSKITNEFCFFSYFYNGFYTTPIKKNLKQSNL